MMMMLPLLLMLAADYYSVDLRFTYPTPNTNGQRPTEATTTIETTAGSKTEITSSSSSISDSIDIEIEIHNQNQIENQIADREIELNYN